jgi:hypothetical protein
MRNAGVYPEAKYSAEFQTIDIAKAIMRITQAEANLIFRNRYIRIRPEPDPNCVSVEHKIDSTAQ